MHAVYAPGIAREPSALSDVGRASKLRRPPQELATVASSPLNTGETPAGSPVTATTREAPSGGSRGVVAGIARSARRKMIVRLWWNFRGLTSEPGQAALQPEELGGFVVHEAQRLRRREMSTIVSTLRSYVRFLFVTGVIERELSGSIPPVKVTRFGALPVGAEPVALDALLSSCDRTSVTGRRDYAVLVLMSRFGLRSGSSTSRLKPRQVLSCA